MNFLKRLIYGRRWPDYDQDSQEYIDVSEYGITVDPLTSRPHEAWYRLKQECQVEKLQPMSPTSPISESSIRFVCVADTHVKPERKGADIEEIVPPGDVLLHAGDFTMYGREDELKLFNSYFGRLQHKVKILIAGNHDQTLDPNVHSQKRAESHRHFLTNFTYLEDAMVDICGIKVYGAPWVPYCGNWGFVRPRGIPLLRKWNMIPNDTDILMTHGPPLGYGDTEFWGYSVGCVELLNTVRQRVQPKYHVYGHIHEGYGMYTDGQTTFINAAMCNKSYKPVNPPIVFDYPLPPGHSKRELENVLTSLKQYKAEVSDTDHSASGQVVKDEEPVEALDSVD